MPSGVLADRWSKRGTIAIGMASGGFLYAFSPVLCLGISSASAAAGVFASLALGTGIAAPETLSAEAPRRDLGSRLGTLRGPLSSPGLVAILAAACLAGAAFGTIDEYNGMWSMERYGIPLAAVGLWSILPFGAQGLGGMAAGRTAGFLKGDGGRRMPIALAFTGVIIVAAALLPGVWGVAPYLLHYFAASALSVAFEGKIQAGAADESRATLLSLSNLLMTLCAMGFSPFFGLAAMKGGLRAAFTIAGCLSFAAALALRLWGGKPHR